MAILWQKTIRGQHYEIRSAGRTRRLYTNGVCHSEFNPFHIFSGSIWDLLILPAWFYSASDIRRILVLGVGGGSNVLQLEHLLEPELILGIERDPVHLRLARKFFDIENSCSEIIEVDARGWLANYNGEPFDMIIDDLFMDCGNEPVRAVKVNREWSQLLIRNLKKGGLLTINFASGEELTASAIVRQSRFHHRFPSMFRMTTPLLDNNVGVFIGRQVNSRYLRERLRRHPVAERAIANRRIRYRINQLV
ncbi:MAG: hypothetical protein WD750_08790 [Gammaproteobacteria bacterium]